MVDFQPILDIHKNEVYKIAKKLNVIEAIINAIPKGDVFDGRNDIEMIGASYDDVELTTLCFDFRELILNNEEYMQEYLIFFESESYKNIKNLHLTNQHKYKVGTPFHILNVMGFANSFRDI
jgi:NH3-dependent NAD+ synthetase